MKSKTQLQQSQNTMMRPSSSTYGSRQEESALRQRGSQANISNRDIDKTRQDIESALNTGKKSSVGGSNESPSSNPWRSSDEQCKQYSDDSDNFVEALFDGTWRSTVSSVSNDLERKVSSESVESDVSSTTMEASSSLDDVFDELFDGVLDEMDAFESGQGGIAPFWPAHVAPIAPFGTPMPMGGPFTTPLIHQIDENPQHKTSGLFQRPDSHIQSHSFNPFQAFNFGLVKGLENPSRGLITVIRRLCDLLSRPRSDHLDSVFVRLLNNALKEMEDAAHPSQPKRLRKKAERRHVTSKRQKIKANKFVSDGQSGSRSDIYEGLSWSFECQSIKSNGSENDIDLTGSGDNEKDDCQRQQDSHLFRDESFIALEDTMSDFMSTLLH